MSEIKVNKISPRTGTDVTLGDSGDTFTIPSGATLTNSGTANGFGAVSWQSTIVTGATHTAVSGQAVWINTTSNACTVTLPSSPSVGDEIILSDFARTWGSNAVTINQNGNKFQNYTSPNPVYDTTGETVHIVYSGSSQGWIPINDGAVAWETPQLTTVDFLCIAGGAGGGKSNAGGGGAGGYRASFNNETSGGGGSSETALALSEGTVYTITVGAGGSGTSSSSSLGGNGNNSSISGSGITTITSIGGGGGSSDGSSNTGNDGGSGGGSASGAPGGSGTANQGYDGSSGYSGASSSGGGGGGASATGGSAPQAVGGAGGAGQTSTITGSSVQRAGGGGGVTENSGGTQGAAGAGGGTAGVYNGFPGNATANTGSGGGGRHTGTGNSGGGGSGVVILRMATSDYSGTTSGSPTVDQSTVSGQTILIYNSSGSYTA